MAPQLTIDGRELELSLSSTAAPAPPAEGLFALEAFAQLSGQRALELESEPESARERQDRSTSSDAAAEERAAREQLRQLERMQRGAAAARERDRRERMRAALRETRARYPRCKCELRVGMTPAELQHLAGGCTDPNYVCPRLAAVRRIMNPKRAS